MSYTLLFLTATLLPGGADDCSPGPRPIQAVAGAAGCCDCKDACGSKGCGLFARLGSCFNHEHCGCGDTCERPGWRDRLRGLFGHKCCAEPCCDSHLPVIKSEVPPLA